MTESRWNPEKPLAIAAICIIGIPFSSVNNKLVWFV